MNPLVSITFEVDSNKSGSLHRQRMPVHTSLCSVNAANGTYGLRTSQTLTLQSNMRAVLAMWYFRWGRHLTRPTEAIVQIVCSGANRWSMFQTLIVLSLPAVASHDRLSGCQSTENTGPEWAVNCFSGRSVFLKSHICVVPLSDTATNC